jgi:hypothetical protein
MPVARITFHGQLEDFLPVSRRGKELVQTFFGSTSVKDAIESAGVPHPELNYVIVDGAGVPLTHRLSKDARILVYGWDFNPDPIPEVRVGLEFPEPRRFALDVNLGRLAFDLRMLGFDSVWKNDFGDGELAKLVAREDRICLTRDIGLLKRSDVKHGYWPRASGPWQQLAEVVTRFGLDSRARPFSRCMKCNGVLQRVRKEDVVSLVPPKVAAEFKEFMRCPGCGQEVAGAYTTS